MKNWRELWKRLKAGYAAGVLVTTALFLTMLFVNAIQHKRQMEEQGSTGLGAVVPVETFGLSPFREAKLERVSTATMNYMTPVSGGGGGGNREDSEDQKLVRKCAIVLLVDDPEKGAEDVRFAVEELGGHVLRSVIEKPGGIVREAEMSVLVPADRLDEARTRLRGLARQVRREQVEQQDVTKQYRDLESTIRNYKVEEEQYRQLMRRTGSVEAMLQVVEQLADVRQRIESAEGDLRHLERQVEMSSIKVRLEAEVREQIAGIRWQPARRAKLAGLAALDSLGDYAASVLEIVLHIPVVLLWIFTIALLAAAALRLVRWLWRRLMPRANPDLAPAALE